MDDADRARTAAREAVADVEPARLRETLHDRLDASPMTPAVLTLVSARAFEPAVDGLADRAAGVQLIYEGLRLTRTLAHEEPWADADGEADIDADLDILAADVLVARGFYVLARTEAATRAVEVVRAFGRDQTLRESAADPASLDGNLEADVLALAVVAGATAVGRDPPEALVSFATDLARERGGGEAALAEPSTLLPERAAETIASLGDAASGSGSGSGSGEDRVPPSPTDP
jgi:hypothetical protein